MTVRYYTEYEPEVRRQPFAGGWIGWSFLALVAIVIGVLSFFPSDYVVERPGPAYDTLGTIEVDGSPIPLIDIPSVETYPTTGSLSMLTVSTVGNRDNRVSWWTVAEAWLDPTQDLLDLDDVYPEGQTTEQAIEVGKAQMVASQEAAIAGALSNLGYDYSTTVSVVATTAGGPSEELILEGDTVMAVNGEAAPDATTLRALIAKSGAGEPLTVSLLRDGAPLDVTVTPVLSEGEEPQPIIGIEITTLYDFPFEISVQLSDVGGPSAGQIFALAIIDKLTPGSLTGGLSIAGTGTITESGQIGAIGGITQKLYGAQRAGARYFLAPATNCADIARGSVPKELDIFAVNTLADSLYVLNTLSTGAGTSLLPRCPVT